MPLIDAVRRWLRRERDFLGMTSQDTLYFYLSFLIWVFTVVLLPIVAFLVLIGVVYEVIARIDRREWLDEWTRWTISSIATISIVALAAIAILGWT